MTVANRLWHARFAPGTNAYGPTQRESYRIGRELYVEIVAELDDISAANDALKAPMDASKVPWSPGR